MARGWEAERAGMTTASLTFEEAATNGPIPPAGWPIFADSARKIRTILSEKSSMRFNRWLVRRTRQHLIVGNFTLRSETAIVEIRG